MSIVLAHVLTLFKHQTLLITMLSIIFQQINLAKNSPGDFQGNRTLTNYTYPSCQNV